MSESSSPSPITSEVCRLQGLTVSGLIVLVAYDSSGAILFVEYCKPDEEERVRAEMLEWIARINAARHRAKQQARRRIYLLPP